MIYDLKIVTTQYVMKLVIKTNYLNIDKYKN